MTNIYNHRWQLKWQLNTKLALFRPVSSDVPQLGPYNEKGPSEGLFIWLLGKLLVGARGFEPPTPRSRTECSTRLSHAPTEANIYFTPDPTVNATLPFAVARVSRSRTDTSSSYWPGGNGCSGTVCVANAAVSQTPGGGRSPSAKNCGFV